MAISKIILNGTTQMDLTQDTVTAATLMSPRTAHGADGQAITGTASAGGDTMYFRAYWDDSLHQVVSEKTYRQIEAAIEDGKSVFMLGIPNPDSVSVLAAYDPTPGVRQATFMGIDNYGSYLEFYYTWFGYDESGDEDWVDTNTQVFPSQS